VSPRRVAILVACVLGVAACSGDDGPAPLPSATPTVTGTATSAPSDTPSPSRSATVTPTATSSATATASPTSSASPTPTPSPSATSTRTPIDPQLACDSLAGRSIGGAEIRSAALAAATDHYPEYCRVSGTIAPQLNFELRLPTAWNGRALFTGGGGLDGIILPPELIFFNPSIAFEGYVTIATDSGHAGSPNDGVWALGDPLALENFAYLSTHSVLGAARQIVQERYGERPRRSYFIGESTGGREGLIAAQRWPDDFDGIVALEPVYDMSALILAGNRVAQQVFRSPGTYLSAAKVGALARATLAACDDLDGIADGIISHLAACHFDPAVLRCAGPENGDCLTDEQIDTVNTVHSALELSFTLANGIQSYPGWPVGHEDGSGGWATWVTGSSPSPTSSLGFNLSDQTLRYLVVGNPALDTLELAPATYAQELGAFSALVDATNADLAAFAARGGKLILWHGLADYGVSAYSTIRYYERVVATLGGEAVDDFLRFYTSPGVDHLNGGPGAGTADYLGALVAWVEEGTAPGDLVAHKVAGETLSRPLCRYPAYPQYNGKGDPASSASFHCALP
jgi:Tannase and feruloyl esterase